MNIVPSKMSADTTTFISDFDNISNDINRLSRPYKADDSARLLDRARNLMKFAVNRADLNGYYDALWAMSCDLMKNTEAVFK